MHNLKSNIHKTFLVNLLINLISFVKGIIDFLGGLYTLFNLSCIYAGRNTKFVYDLVAWHTVLGRVGVYTKVNCNGMEREVEVLRNMGGSDVLDVFDSFHSKALRTEIKSFQKFLFKSEKVLFGYV